MKERFDTNGKVVFIGKCPECHVNKKVLLNRVMNILSGMDLTSDEDVSGWWDTSFGANFGKLKMNEIKNLFLE